MILNTSLVAMWHLIGKQEWKEAGQEVGHFSSPESVSPQTRITIERWEMGRL